MKTMKSPIVCLLLLITVTTRGQGTFVYDQESSTDEAYPIGGPPIKFYGTVGQSFAPSLAMVGFVRLKLDDVNRGNALGGTLVVNLRSTAINGPIIGTTTPVTLVDGFAGSVNFFFATAVPVTPATTYYLQAIIQSGDDWGITTMSNTPGDNYPNGMFYGGLQPFSAGDLWFREGIVVPEPSSALLFFMGSGVAGWFMRQKSRRLHCPMPLP